MDQDIKVYHYCVSYIDLLGHRMALEGQELIPNNAKDALAFEQTIINSIGAIVTLQHDADALMRSALDNSSFRLSLPAQHQSDWDEMMKDRVKLQRWSDGLVNFVALTNKDVRCPMSGIFRLFLSTGSLCMTGLVRGFPIRGAIEVAWGVELHDNELYGAALSQAYKLENEIAQYPRIVVGDQAVNLLHEALNDQKDDHFAQFNKALAQSCLNMLIRDVDGVWIVHYLGNEFLQTISAKQREEIYNMAHTFIKSQIKLHYDSKDTKLAFRYKCLFDYFNSFPLATPDNLSTS